MITVDYSNASTSPWWPQDSAAVWESVQNFFASCKEWFETNAEWIWPVAVLFVGVASLVMALMLSCFLCGQSSSTTSHPPLRAPHPSPTYIPNEKPASPTFSYFGVTKEQLKTAITQAINNQSDSDPTQEQLDEIKNILILLNQQDGVDSTIYSAPTTREEADQLINDLKKLYSDTDI